MSSKDLELYFDTKESLNYAFLVRKKMFELDAVDEAKRYDVLHNLLVHLGRNSVVGRGFRCEYANITIGDNCVINMDCCFLDVAGVKLGNNVWIAPQTCIFTVAHPVVAEARANFACTCGAVEIGDGVWIGGNCTINPGVKIGKNSVIGSGSVVTKDIPENVVAVGNPCRVLRKITASELADYRQKLAEFNTKKQDKTDIISREIDDLIAKNKNFL